MKIPKDKKKQILIDKEGLSINEISRKYNLPRSEVKNIINAAEKKVPKWFYAVLVIIPFIILTLLEVSLRIFNYGYDNHQWVEAGGGKLIINPDIGKRYFNNINFVPKTIEDTFDEDKKLNAFRVFVLGGSSAEGYPFTPLGSFSRYIRRRLELVYPHTHIEVINISMTAVGSYTLLDLLPGVLEQKPDLILIYAGHNEYYGALGVGSMESFSSSQSLTRLILYLNEFKITQLVRNSIHWISSLFSSQNGKKSPGTLMSRMAKNQYILLNSGKFNAGIEQFKENLSSILNLIKNKGVPVIIGELVSNLKDQKPFISVNTNGYETADQIYNEAETVLGENKFYKADSLFRLAKDLDALRFRAPEKMNGAIVELCREFNAKVVPTDSVFNSNSPEGIVGDNLIVDHLHPNIIGNQLLGKAYYDVMEKWGYLPDYERPVIPFKMQDSLAKANFMFTVLDSLIGNDIITILKNDWPFVKSKKQETVNLLSQKEFLDETASEYIENKITWADAHLKVATIYLRRDDIKNYLKYMNVLIYQYPELKDLRSALKYFYKSKKIDPGDYTIKRIGLIDLFNKNYRDALKNLSESYKLNPNDTMVVFSLAKCYFELKDFKSALGIINRCLTLNHNYPDANVLKQRIQDSIKIGTSE